MSDIPEAKAWVATGLGCEPVTVADITYCIIHDLSWLTDVNMCPTQERMVESLALRDEAVRADERERMLADVHNIARATRLTGTDVRTIINAIRETAAIRLAEHARLDPEETTP